MSALKAKVKSRRAHRVGRQTFCRCHDTCVESVLTLFHVHLVSVFVPKEVDAFFSPQHPSPSCSDSRPADGPFPDHAGSRPFSMPPRALFRRLTAFYAVVVRLLDHG